MAALEAAGPRVKITCRALFSTLLFIDIDIPQYCDIHFHIKTMHTRTSRKPFCLEGDAKLNISAFTWSVHRSIVSHHYDVRRASEAIEDFQSI